MKNPEIIFRLLSQEYIDTPTAIGLINNCTQTEYCPSCGSDLIKLGDVMMCQTYYKCGYRAIKIGDKISRI